MKRLCCIALAALLVTVLLMSGCKSRSESPTEDELEVTAVRGKGPLQGKWRVAEVKGANPDIFINEVWEFKNNRYSVKGLSLSGKYDLGTDGDNNTIMLFQNDKTAVRGAGIYEVRERGEELIMKI
jgi:hypothetical protein